jgi:PAS domain S-box-containing protein
MGQVFKMYGTGQDISERKTFETALWESEEQYRNLVETARDVIFTISSEGIITSLNSAFEAITGWSRQRWIGRPFPSLLHPDDVAAARERFQRIVSGELLPIHEWRILSKSGGYIVGEITSTSQSRDGKIVGILGIARDITERKRLQQKLDEIARHRMQDLHIFATHIQRAQEEERRRIARELHDDLGQQLSGLKFTIEVLEDAVAVSNKNMRQRLNNIKERTDNMIHTIRRISADLHPSALDDFGLRVALQLLCKEFEKEKRTKITFHTTDDQMKRFDSHVEIALYRIAQEALSNAAKHADAADVTVELCHNDGTVSLTIEDNGKGFDISKVQARKGSERGLGLISMKERLEHLSGIFRIESTALHGTRIRVEVPLHQ